MDAGYVQQHILQMPYTGDRGKEPPGLANGSDDLLFSPIALRRLLPCEDGCEFLTGEGTNHQVTVWKWV
jgi:hypothetical protein